MIDSADRCLTILDRDAVERFFQMLVQNNRRNAAGDRLFHNVEIVVDVTKDKRRVFDQNTNKWVNSEEYENNLAYRGQPKAAAPMARRSLTITASSIFPRA